MSFTVIPATCPKCESNAEGIFEETLALLFRDEATGVYDYRGSTKQEDQQPICDNRGRVRLACSSCDYQWWADMQEVEE